jgi:hypothetical protein
MPIAALREKYRCAVTHDDVDPASIVCSAVPATYLVRLHLLYQAEVLIKVMTLIDTWLVYVVNGARA